MDTAVAALIKHLKKNELTLALAESVTCGLAAHKLSTCPGTSEVFRGSLVCYSPEVKQHTLGISKKMIDEYTAESQEVTDALAKKLSKLIKADIYAALTGLASAGGTETKEKPVGTVFFSIYYKKKIYKKRRLFRGTPLEIREKACLALYDWIKKTVQASS
jgi:nicotinamide-nucleotide amidase